MNNKKKIAICLIFILALLFCAFKLSDLGSKINKKQDDYEVKNAQKTTGVRGLDDEGGSENIDPDQAAKTVIPYTNISDAELSAFTEKGGLK